MTRRGIWFAFLMSGALALTACSWGRHSSTVTPTAPAPSASASPYTVHTGLLTQEFATPLPSDAAQAEVVAGFRRGLVLWDVSSEQRKLIAPVTSYVTGAALASLKKVISTFAKTDEVPAGVDRFFLTRVTALTGSVATLTTCDDGSKYVQENPATGAVDPAFTNVPIEEQYVYETWGMTRLSGHWAIKSISFASPGSAGERQCLPA
jgi:hypothetical protein